MKKNIILITFFIIVNYTHILAQKTLTLKDSETLKTIQYVQVLFSQTEDMRINKGGVTNADGKITIPYNGKCYFKVHFIGYETKTGIINAQTENLEILLTPYNYELNQIVVTGSRAPRSLSSSPVVTQVISANRLTESGFGSIEKALMQEMPGLNFQKVGFGTDINVSGLDARHVLFLIDGERLTGEMAGNLDYQRFNLHAIDRVEIVKGASSTLYGSRAAGAVINMITKKTNKPFEAKIGVRYGQKNQQNYDNPEKTDFLYMYEKNVDKPNLQSWVSLGSNFSKFTSQTDIFYSSSDAFYLFQEGFDKKTFPADKSIGLLKDTTITSWLKRPPLGVEGTEHINLSQKLYYDANDRLSMKLYGSYFFMNTYDMVQDLQFSQAEDLTGGIKTSYKFGKYAEATLSIHTDYYNRYKRQERKDTNEVVYDSKIYQPRFILSSNYFNRHSFMLGVDYYGDELLSDRFKNSELTRRKKKDLDFFAQDEFTLNDKITLVGGVRSSYNENYGTNIAPKLAIKYTPENKLSFRFNYAAGYRSPSIKELYFNWDHLGMFQIIGDEFLKPEKNNYFSLSAQYSVSKLFLLGNLYANYFRDKIEGVWRIYDFQYNFEYRNLAKNRILGAELMGKIKVLNPLTLNFSYSYVNVSKTDGVQLNTSAPNTGSLHLEFQHKKKDYQLKSNIGMAITGTKKFSIQDKIIIDNKSHKAYFYTEIPSYAICNFSIMQKFRDAVEMTVGINNFLDYKPKTLGAGVTMFNVPATPGRRFFVQANFSIENLNRLF